MLLIARRINSPLVISRNNEREETSSPRFRGCSLHLIMGELQSRILEVVKEREQTYEEYNDETSMLQPTIKKHPIIGSYIFL